MVWYSYLLNNFPQLIVIHIVKGFGIVNKAEIDVFLELFCVFNDPVDVGTLISDSFAFSKMLIVKFQSPSFRNMPANLENSAVAAGLEKVSFHSNPKERQCQGMLKLCTVALISHAKKVILKILQARLQQYVYR